MTVKRILLHVLVLLLGTAGAVTAATIELPVTGQVTCYDRAGTPVACAGTGQDGDTQAGASLPVPRFAPDYYGLTVVDNLTGLMWTLDSRTPDEYPYVCAPVWRLRNWQDALDYVACLNVNNFLGYNDWRLPNRRELRSLIVDNSTANPALPLDHPFINVEEDGTEAYNYWTSTTCHTILVEEGQTIPPTEAYKVRMWDGADTCGDKTKDEENRLAWPVRAGQTNGLPDPAYPANIPVTGQVVCYGDTTWSTIPCAGTGHDGELQSGVLWPNPRYTITFCNEAGPCANPSVDCDGDPLNDVVTDNLTGLIWVRVPDNIHRTWIESVAYSNGLTTCGYVNWRLPNINELESMINNGEPDTAVWLNVMPFIGVESYLHWTSTTHRIERDQAMLVDLWDGSIENYSKDTFFYAWPVRLPGYQLSVTKVGAGSGTVTSVPPGINCGTDCKEIFPEGTQVTLTAVADPGFIFKGWSGVCSGTGSCIVTMEADAIVTATFETCTYTLTPTNTSFPADGGTITVSVTASGLPSCPEPAVSSDAGWITAQLIKFVNNTGKVSVTATPSNSSNNRRANIIIGNATFVVKQGHRICPLPKLNPSFANFTSLGGFGSFTVSFPATAPADCGWVAKARKGWIVVNALQDSGVGNGTVSFDVLTNLRGKPLDGNIKVILNQDTTRWKTFSIHQSE